LPAFLLLRGFPQPSFTCKNCNQTEYQTTAVPNAKHCTAFWSSFIAASVSAVAMLRQVDQTAAESCV